MASKKDLVEAQTFSRRRLLTAFVSGAPGGRELEPTKPLRAVVTGVGLSVLVVLGSLGSAMLKAPAPTGWDDNRMIVVTDTGARYVSVLGVLHPVLNTASARLALSGGLTDPVTLSESQIAGTPRGATIGIPGAPDEVPPPDRLVNDGWLSCTGPDGAMVTLVSDTPETQELAAQIQADAADGGPSDGLLVEVSGEVYLITEGRRYLIPGDQTPVLRALGMTQTVIWQVPAAWLNLFPPGSNLVPLQVPGAGGPLADPSAAPEGAQVGSVLHITESGSPEEPGTSYVIFEDGSLAKLTDLSLAMYRAGGYEQPAIEDNVGATSGMDDYDGTMFPADWPAAAPALIQPGTAACAQLSTPAVGATGTGAPATPVRLAAAPVTLPDTGAAVQVAPGAGALVRPVAGTATAEGVVQLIDQNGIAFALPEVVGDDTEVLGRLGYTSDDVVAVPQAWLPLFGVGPELTVSAAQQPYVGPVQGDGAAASADGAATGFLPPAAVGGEGEDDASGQQSSGAQSCDPERTSYVAMKPPALDRLGADAAWQLASGRGVVVAVVDSGVAEANVHLRGAVEPGADLTGLGDERGWTDTYHHGTAVAGVIAARAYSAPGDGSGVIGLAPEARILPVRVYVADDETSRREGTDPTAEGMAAGIVWAVDHGAQIINLSMSTVHDNADLAEAVRYANSQGVLIVASAGNRATSESEEDGPRYPAAYDGVLGVAAVDDLDRGVQASIHGPHVDVAAPGTMVVTTYIDKGDCVFGADGSSSYATAYVSAAAALIAERYPLESPAQWAHRLMATASRPQADQRDDVIGWGVVRPWAALTFVDDGTAPGPDSPVHDRPAEERAVLPPVTSSVRADELAPARQAAVGWAFGAVAALTAALLCSFPGLRRRRRRRS